MKYFDIHMKVSGDSKKGYSIFVELPDTATENDAIKEIIEKKLYEDEGDIKNIDWIGRITKEEYKAAYPEKK